MNDLISNELKEIVQLQRSIKLDDLEYTTKRAKRYNFSRDSLPIIFLRAKHADNADSDMLMKSKLR